MQRRLADAGIQRENRLVAMESLSLRFRHLKKSGQKVSALTAYDYPTARMVDEAGVDLILVGDSLGMVVLGHPDTTSVTLDDMIRHTGAVARGVKRAPVITDLPIHTYDTPEQALRSARLIMDAGAQGVKIEGGTSVLPQMKVLTSAGIPVLAHLGMLPQQIHEEGGYKIKGRSAAEAESLLLDAAAVQAAGAIAVVLEIVTPDLASRISALLEIPTIGIGSGDGCDGQILVLHDLVGLYPWFRPKFVIPRADLGSALCQAVRDYTQDIHAGSTMTPP